MTTALPDQIISTDEFIRLADSAPDEVTLELVRGEVRQRTRESTPRFSSAIARIGYALANWLELDGEPELPGFHCGVESLFVGKRKTGQTPTT